MSPDGRNLYLASYRIGSQEGLAVLSRDPVTGAITQLPGPSGCLTADGSSAVGPATCTPVRGFGIGDGRDLVFTADGRWAYLAYVIADNNAPADGVAIFALDPASGAATQLPGTAGCITADGTSSGAGVCGNGGPALEGIYDPTVSPDGASVYLPGYDGQTLSVYRREGGPSCQPVSASTPYQTAVTITLRCQDTDGEPLTTSIATPPAHGTLTSGGQTPGTVLYTPEAGYSGTDSFAFSASDATNASAPATATVTIAPASAHTPPAVLLPGGRPQVTRPPRLTHLRESLTAWRELRRTPHHAPTSFSFTLNEAARVTLTFSRDALGRRVRGRCVAQARGHRHAPPCVHTVTLGALAVRAHAGQNRIGFDGHLPQGGWLPRGRITVTAIAAVRDERSAARRLSFVIR